MSVIIRVSRGGKNMNDKNKVSRRQFLNYSLTDLGGFMAAGVLIASLRFGVDPLFKHSSGAGDLVSISLTEDDSKEEPQRVNWEAEQVDGWYESNINRTAWVLKDDI